VQPEANGNIRTLSAMATLFADQIQVAQTLAVADPVVYRTSTAPVVQAEGHLGFTRPALSLAPSAMSST
jgi:hypothetical protein